MAASLRPPIDPAPKYFDELARRRAGVAAAAALLVLGLSVMVALLREPTFALSALQAVSLSAFVTALGVQALIGRRLHDRRNAREQGFTRMLQELSRSLSAEAIVQAIVEELRRAADADYVIVSRVRPAERMVETTLVSASALVPTSRTIFPLNVLDPAAAHRRSSRSELPMGRSPGQVVADDLAGRLGRAYGLPRTLAVPLMANERIVGALMLSRRQDRAWTVADRRLLTWSAHELSVALARAYAFAEAESQANIDALTSLPNRRYLEELIAVVEPCRRVGDSLGALMIDIDHFKRLNDRYGHAAGDRVLRAVGERINTAVRADDTPARYGGEEFAVVLRRANDEQALEVAERIRQTIGAIPPRELGIQDAISVSVGVAVSGPRDVDLVTLLESADRGLYRAKREGRNRVVLA
jgi:diguanylate cyclase (GGDEF)-like protein